MSTRHVTSHPPSLRAALLVQRYLRKNDQGRTVECPIEMFRRVARAVSQAEAAYDACPLTATDAFAPFLQMMADGHFLPNSPTLMIAGKALGVLSACFVLPVEDSIDGIFQSIWHTAPIQKAGGGTGFSFDNLRPTGDRVASSGGQTSGPISFMHVFSEAIRAIQKGSLRRGASMGMVSVCHQDILKFVTAKKEPGAFENFNLSVKVTDAFMQALKQNPKDPHVVTNPRDGKRYVIPRDVDLREYGISDLLPVGIASKGCYSVEDVWNLIVVSAHATGEPGLCFIDRVNRDNPTPALGKIEATNPCGEQPLLPYESCVLGSINLAKFVDRKVRKVRWRALRNAIGWATLFLDDVIDASTYPLPRIEQVTRGNRKIGLGIMGFADALALLGIRYDSEAAVNFAQEVGRFLSQHAHQASESLAAIRGRFPNWVGSTWDTEHHRPMRNAACTTIAPTGSISILARCSSGIEPIFGVVSRRRALDREFVEIHPLVERLGRQNGWLTPRVRAALLEGLPPREIRGFPRELADLLITAHEVSPEWHVRVQAAFQRPIDGAVSKTVNLPAMATVADVDKVFRMAYELGSKGITVYREDSQPGQALSVPGRPDAPAPHSLVLDPRPCMSGDVARALEESPGGPSVAPAVQELPTCRTQHSCHQPARREGGRLVCDNCQ